MKRAVKENNVQYMWNVRSISIFIVIMKFDILKWKFHQKDILHEKLPYARMYSMYIQTHHYVREEKFIFSKEI